MTKAPAQDVVGISPNEAQDALIDAISSGFDEADLPDAVKLGYASKASLTRAVGSDPVQAALKMRRAARIKASLAQKAMQTVEDLLKDGTPAATRFAAAKWVLEQAGHTNEAGEGKDKPLAEMSEAELLAFMAKMEKIVAEGGNAPLLKVTP